MLLWKWNPSKEWQPVILAGDTPFSLNGHAQLLPLPRGSACLLLARPGVKVNGLASLPAQVLADRDEIRCGGEVVFFSAESPAAVEVFTVGKKPVRCPRCKSEFTGGTEVIYCPRCRSPHHTGCWTYGPLCTNCDRSTEAYGWVPDPLREKPE